MNDGGVVKPEIVSGFTGDNDIGGNLSSFVEYYNELKYFAEKLTANEALEVAPLDDAVKSAELVFDEIKIVGGVQI